MMTFGMVLFILLLCALLLLHIFSLPANWIIATLVAVWKWTHLYTELTWPFISILFGLALLGEIIQFWVQAHSTKRYGGSTKGNIGGMIGAILGAIAGAPIGFGLGALPGAFIGAFVGCLIFEKLHGKDTKEAIHASKGAFWGAMFGFIAKMSLGATMVVLSIPRIWM